LRCPDTIGSTGTLGRPAHGTSAQNEAVRRLCEGHSAHRITLLGYSGDVLTAMASVSKHPEITYTNGDLRLVAGQLPSARVWMRGVAAFLLGLVSQGGASVNPGFRRFTVTDVNDPTVKVTFDERIGSSGPTDIDWILSEFLTMSEAEFRSTHFN
jgi:hypothetical protein